MGRLGDAPYDPLGPCTFGQPYIDWVNSAEVRRGIIVFDIALNVIF
jgi:hypothetical protein